MPLMSSTEIVDERVRRIVNGRRLFAPISRRKPWTTSRLVEVTEGKTIPLLELIAQAKFAEWNPKEYFAYWRDKNWENESWDNVELASLQSRSRRDNAINPYGAPAGTPEYHRAYREKNKDRFKAYYKTRRDAANARMAEYEKALKERAAASSPSETPSEILQRGDSLLSELRELIPREPGK